LTASELVFDHTTMGWMLRLPGVRRRAPWTPRATASPADGELELLVTALLAELEDTRAILDDFARILQARHRLQ
jgi:hypothetical protein